MSRRKAWCSRCGLVDSVDSAWRCIWCGHVTLGGGTRYAPRAARFASVAVVREAHRLHAEGETVLGAARATIGRTTYQDVAGYAMTLRECWALLELPTRSRADAQILRARTEPPARRVRTRPNYRHDVDTAELAAHYARTLSTVRTGAAFGMSQQGVYGRLRPLGLIVSHGARKERRKRELAAASSD